MSLPTSFSPSRGSDRIDHFKERKLAEIGITGTDSVDTVFAHENCGVRVMHEITREVGQFSDDFVGDVGVSGRRDKNAKRRGGQQGRNKVPRCGCRPWSAEDTRMSYDAQKLIENSPSRIPGIRPPPLNLNPLTTWSVEWRVNVRGVHQDIGIHRKHYRPSIA
jgi:hypothetical protein